MTTALALGFIGGTGAEGAALALRYARVGHAVAIGSRSLERAQQTAAEINKQLTGQLLASGFENPGAVQVAQVVFLTIPYAGLNDTLAPITGTIEDRVVVSTVVPMTFQDRRPVLVPSPAGSAAQEVQGLLPTARVVGAFHHISARHLEEIDHPLEGDVLVCGDDAEAKATIMALVGELPNLRPLDVGGLDYAHHLEALTPVLLSLNRRYRAQSGLQIIGIEAQ